MNITITGSAKEIAELVRELNHNGARIEYPANEKRHTLTLEEMPCHSQAAPPPDLMELMTCNNG